MLQTNPKKRLTIEQILTHPWINKGNASGVAPPKNISVQKHFLDEEVFWDCHLLFPSVPIFELRQNIMYKFGYHHAAYQLLKDKPKELKVSQLIRFNIMINYFYFNFNFNIFNISCYSFPFHVLIA